MTHTSMRALLLSLLLGAPQVYAQEPTIEPQEIHSILQITDMQNGFMEGGELGIEKSGKALDNIVKILHAINNDEIDSTNLTIVASQDWHPEDFKGFSDVDGVLLSNNGKAFATPEAAAEHKHPRHCVAGTPGAEIVDPIKALLEAIAQKENGPRVVYVHKGTETDHDQTSMFHGHVVQINQQQVTGLTLDYLYTDLIEQGYRIKEYGSGVVTGICVQASLEQPVEELGREKVKNRVIYDATRGLGLSKEMHRQELGRVIANGAKPISADQFLAKFAATRGAFASKQKNEKEIETNVVTVEPHSELSPEMQQALDALNTQN